MMFVVLLFMASALIILVSLLRQRPAKDDKHPSIVRQEPVNRLTRYYGEDDPTWNDYIRGEPEANPDKTDNAGFREDD